MAEQRGQREAKTPALPKTFGTRLRTGVKTGFCFDYEFTHQRISSRPGRGRPWAVSFHRRRSPVLLLPRRWRESRRHRRAPWLLFVVGNYVWRNSGKTYRRRNGRRNGLPSYYRPENDHESEPRR